MFYDKLYDAACPVVRLFYRIFFFASVKGRENVPKSGGAIICGNHSSNHDGVIIAAFTPRRLKFMAKKELFKNPFFAKVLTGLGLRPVDRGGHDISIVKTALRILKDGDPMVIFPEATRSLKDINDCKDGAVVLAIKTRVPIIPVHIINGYKLFHKVKVIYGKPYDLSEYYGKRLLPEEIHEITLDVMKKIYSMNEA